MQNHVRVLIVTISISDIARFRYLIQAAQLAPKFFCIDALSYEEGNLFRNKNMSAIQDILYHVTGRNLLSIQIIANSHLFGQSYFGYRSTSEQEGEWPPDVIIWKMGELNGIRRTLLILLDLANLLSITGVGRS